MIRVSGLYKRFGATVAVDGVSLHVRKQEICGLVGPDGAGKTTLMRMVCGLLSPDRGEVSMMDYPPGLVEKAKEHLGYMPQRFSLYGDLTVWENIRFFGAMYGLSKGVIDRRAGEILNLTNLAGFKNRLGDNLSGGMKQKLALTCSLVTRPDILVLDEPTYGVDPESRKEFWKILYDLNKQGMTILISTPYMDEAELCQVVAFIHQGRIVAQDSPLGLRDRFPYQVLEVSAQSRDPDLFTGLPEVADASLFADKYHLMVSDLAAARRAVERRMQELGTPLSGIREIPPSMEDIFIVLAEKG